MRFAVLSSYQSPDAIPCTGFLQLAESRGFEIDVPVLDGVPTEYYLAAISSIPELIADADVFYVPSNVLLREDPVAISLRERVRSGAHLLAQPGPIGGGKQSESKLEWWNWFLAPFDLSVCATRIASNGKTSDVPFTRSPESFRDPSLFAGVDTVFVDLPQAIYYGGESLPVLVGSEKHESFSGITDLPENWNGRELACIASWHGLEGGSVTVLGGDMFCDPGGGSQGIKVNEQLATNLLRLLAPQEVRTTTPEELCQRIEINLVDFVLDTLRSEKGESWWTECVPLVVRQKCAARQEEEENRHPKEAYLDLLDLKTLMTKNWSCFELSLRSVGCEGGKEKSLSWLNRLNELRRLVGHPLKRHVAGYRFSAEEVTFLKTCDARTLTLRNSSKADGSSA